MHRFRVKIFCFGCNKSYHTNLLHSSMPRRCKFCGSIRIMKVSSWRVR